MRIGARFLAPITLKIFFVKILKFLLTFDRTCGII